MLGIFFIALLFDPQAGAAQSAGALAGAVTPAAEGTELKLVVAAPVYQPDGTTSIETANLANAATKFIYGRRSVCDPTSTSDKEPVDAGYGWRLTSRTVSQTAFDMVVSVDWRRVWDRGQRVTNGPAGTVQLTLHPGDRIPLDHIPNAANTSCRAVGMGLEVRLSRTVAALKAPAPSPSDLPLGAQEGGTGTFDADVWLVHTRPAGNQEVLHQKVRLLPTGAAFAFDPVKFTTARGEIQVEIAGSFRRFHAPVNGDLLLVSMARRITGGQTPTGGLGGDSGKMMPMPGPSEVLAFEIPAPEARGGGARGGRGGFGTSGASGGGGGGGGGARGGGTSSGATSRGTGGAVALAQPRTATPQGAAGGRGAGGGGRAAAPGSLERALVQTASVLEGHVFSIRVQLTPASQH